MGRGGSAQQQLQAADPDRPRFHVHPPQGWMNDPNGPVHYKGRYHMFYQHLPNACEWAFGIVWGHAVSSDLVHWQHLPPALMPTPGTLDADGCFSGSCVLDSDGTPVLLYTGVRLRSNEAAGPLPPPEQDLGMVWVESQLAAVPEDPEDELLLRWRKVESPFLHLPPSHLQLTGWRDPFIFVTNTAAAPVGQESGFSTNGYSRHMRMLIGSGLKGQGGTALVYKSRSLLEGWELEGTLCEASNTDTGVVWECPLLVALDPVPRRLRAPGKQAPPRWLIHPEPSSSGASTDGDDVFGSYGSFAQQPDSARARGGIPAVGSSTKLRLALAGVAAAAAGSTAAGGGEAAPAGSDHSATTAGPLPAVVSTAEEAAVAEEEQQQQQPGRQQQHGQGEEAGEQEQRAASGFAFAAHARSDSFEFLPDVAAGSRGTTEAAAASAVHAWGQQATSGGTSDAGSPVVTPRVASAGGSPGSGAPRGRAGAPAQQQQGQQHAVAEAPSNAAVLPPGRRPVVGAKLLLQSVATLEDWSTPSSQALSPATAPSGPASSAASPETSPQRRGGVDRQQQQREAERQRAEEQQRQAEQQQRQQQDEDRFAAAFSRMQSIRARQRSKEWDARAGGLRLQAPNVTSDADRAAAETAAEAGEAAEEEEPSRTPPPPDRQWHFFTISPDAPTNPVLYWMGHVQDVEDVRFELETAKGPYRLDLGDILYAPNVCQDGQGRWLLWGWLQERRKVGSYNYAGCLTLPRELHCTEDGRLVQAPIPELAQLRQGAGWRQHGLRVPAEQAMPLAADPGLLALDIELTIDRGSSFAAGLLFRSYEAEAEGGTALIYDWDRNMLEAIFNVPPNWQPSHVMPGSARVSVSGEVEPFDPALLLTPRVSMINLAAMGGLSRTPSLIFSPEGLGGPEPSTPGSARTATDSLAGEQSGLSSTVLSPQRSGITIAGTPRMWPLDLGIPGIPLPPHLAESEASLGSLGALGSAPGGGGAAGGWAEQTLPRSLSAFPAGFPGGFLGGGLFSGGSQHFEPGSLPVQPGTSRIHRSTSDVRMAVGGLRRAGSHPALATVGSLPRLGGLPSPRRSPQPPLPLGVDTDADLDLLLDELAAPMREAPPPVVEPRRVGGPLPLQQGNHPIHLRVIVDHSCVEVYTGTGEVLSTRIYRGQPPEGSTEPGISFIAFGGTAVVRHCATWEMAGAWDHEAAVPGSATAAAAAKAAAAAGVASPGTSPKPASPLASPLKAGGGSPAALAPAGAEADGVDAAVWSPGGGGGAAPAAGGRSAAAADKLLDDLVAGLPAQPLPAQFASA